MLTARGARYLRANAPLGGGHGTLMLLWKRIIG